MPHSAPQAFSSSIDKIIEVSHWLEDQLGRGVPALLPKAGGFPSGLPAQ